MTEIKLNDDKEWTLTKVHENGKYEVKSRGTLHNPDGIIKLDRRVTVGRGISSYWSTSWVTEIEKINKGIKFHTENSVYLLEEYDPHGGR